MLKRVFLIGFFSLAAHAVTAQEIPSASDLQVRIEASIPGYWEVEDFRVVAAIQQGDPITPKALIRFEASISPSKNLFVSAGDHVGPFEVVVQSFDETRTRTLFGTLQLSFSAGNWSGTPDFENPVNGLGLPRDMFLNPTMILGSEEQQALIEKISDNQAGSAQARLAAELERLEVEGAARVAATEQEFEFRLEALRANYAPKIQAEEARLATEIDRLNQEFETRIAALKTAHASKMVGLRATHAAKLASLERDIAEAEDVVLGQERLMAAQKRSLAIQKELMVSFGKRIPASISCKSERYGFTTAFTLVFVVTDVRSTGLYGHAAADSDVAMSLILLSGPTDKNQRFRFTHGYTNLLKSYEVTLNQNGSITGFTAGRMKYPSDVYRRNRESRCDVSLTVS